MVDKEPNGKGAETPLVRETDPKATDWSAGSAVKALPIIGRVTPMAERQRDRDPASTHSSGSFTLTRDDIFKYGGVLLAAGMAWWSLKGDLRDMRTAQAYENKILEERWQAQVKTNEASARETRMLSITVGDIEKALIRAGIDVDGAEVRIHGREPGGAGR